MGCKLVFSPQAIADLESIVRFIALDDPEAAVRTGEALIARVTILQEFPLIGAPYAKRPGVRKLISRPYLIYYRPNVGEKRVDILRYWHGMRQEPAL